MTTNEEYSWRLLTQLFTEEIHEALLQQHHAAQFIGQARRQLLPRQPDDSHANMEYLPDWEWLIGNELPGGFRMVLSLAEEKLLFIGGNMKSRSEMHYQLPDHDLDHHAPFTSSEQKYLLESVSYRHNADMVITPFASNFREAAPVRIWPHHFDTGTLIPLEHNEAGEVSKSLGLGWAIPDDMVNEPYYYLSFWSEDPVEQFNSLPDPETGEWIRTGWQGRVARHSGILEIPSASAQQAHVETFFHSGIRLLREQFDL